MRKIVIGVLAAIVLLASACQVGVTAWAPCTDAADGNPFGTDGVNVLVCLEGQWVPIMNE